MVGRTNGQRGRAQIAGSDESNGRRIRIRTSGPRRAEEQAAACIQERVATGTHAQEQIDRGPQQIQWTNNNHNGDGNNNIQLSRCRGTGGMYSGSGGEWRLATRKKKRGGAQPKQSKAPVASARLFSGKQFRQASRNRRRNPCREASTATFSPWNRLLTTIITLFCAYNYSTCRYSYSTCPALLDTPRGLVDRSRARRPHRTPQGHKRACPG
jgi:hypothetical protein